MKRFAALIVIVAFTIGELAWPIAAVVAETAPDDGAAVDVDMFDAMQHGMLDVKFIARDSQRGRIVITNKTPNPINVQIPDAFVGVPQVQAQFGGGGGGGGFGGGGGGLGGGGGQQSVGGGGGGGRGGGRGGGGRGGGGRGGGGRGGRFSVPPERVVRVDVPLVCLDHGLREPSSSKPYALMPIENYTRDPALIAIVGAYAAGDLPSGAVQAAVWHLNSEVGWDELAAKQTGTVRSIVREPYFSANEMEAAVAIVEQARIDTAGMKIEPRDYEVPRLPGKNAADDKATEVIEEAAADGGSSADESDEKADSEKVPDAEAVPTVADAQ